MTAPLVNTNVNPPVRELYLDLVYFFPELTHFYGGANTPDHNTKRCLDAMVYDSSKKFVAEQGRSNLGYNDRIALGNRVLAHLRENAKHYGLNGVIWNRHVYGFPHADAPQGRNHYRGPFNVARNYTISAHDDHLHIDQDGSTFKPLRDTQAPLPIGTVWVDVIAPGVVNSRSIRLVQKALGVTETGTYDDATLQAAKDYQKSLGDDVDGWLGPKQLTRLFADKQLPVVIRTEPSGEAPKPPEPEPTPEPEPEPTPEPKPVAAIVRVTSTNMLDDTIAARHGQPRWTRRKAGYIAAVKSTSPDVVLVQEATKGQMADLAAGLGGSWTWWRAEDTSKDDGPIAIMWNTDVLERVGDGSEIELPSNRRGLRVHLQHEKTSKEFDAVCSHLDNGAEYAALRIDQARKLTEWLPGDVKTSEKSPLVFGADLNDKRTGSTGPRAEMRKGGVKFIRDVVKVTNADYESHHGFGSLTKGVGWIDDLGVRGVKVRSAGMVRTDKSSPTTAFRNSTDHNILWAEVEF